MAITQAVNTILFINLMSYHNALLSLLTLFYFLFFLYQDYSFTQIIQVFTFKNKPDISFVHYKLEIYIVGVKISGKIYFKKNVHLTRSQFHLESGGPF